jgi:hypothetical protein
MTTILFKKVDYSLNKLIEDIELGEIGLPEIQRPFVWSNTKVRDLFDSMYRGYPIGYLLFWANGVSGFHRAIGTDAKQSVPRLLIVDGQQRLTSLFAVLKGIPIVREDFRTECIQIAFRPSEKTFEVADAAIRRDPEWIPDISLLWSKDTSRSKVVKGFIQHLRESRDVSENEEERLEEAIDRLYDLQSYPLTALELSSTVSEEQVAEVFVRVNSKGTPLNQADFVLTLMSVFWDQGRADLESFCRAAKQPTLGKPAPFNPFIQPQPDQLLRISVALGFRRARLEHVYSILRGKDLQTGQFSAERREQQFDILRQAQAYALDLQDWHEFFKAVILAGFRRSEFISSQTTLLYTYAFYLIGKRDFRVDNPTLRRIIARWFFMVSLTGRYTASPESRMEQDLADLRDIRDAASFVALLDRTIRTALTDDYWSITLPNDLATSAARGPTLFGYYAALNRLDAKVLFSHLRVAVLMDPSSHAKKAALERHHLFPSGYLRAIGIRERRDINQIANYALVEWSDNISISDASPRDYVPKLAARLGPDELKDMYFWHALPDGWQEMDYYRFLDERRKLMAQVIRRAFEGI